MQKRILYFLGFFMILLFGSSIVLGAESNVCPVGSIQDQTVLSSPTEVVTIPAENPYVKRNQVLLEIMTATW